MLVIESVAAVKNGIAVRFGFAWVWKTLGCVIEKTQCPQTRHLSCFNQTALRAEARGGPQKNEAEARAQGTRNHLKQAFAFADRLSERVPRLGRSLEKRKSSVTGHGSHGRANSPAKELLGLCFWRPLGCKEAHALALSKKS